MNKLEAQLKDDYGVVMGQIGGVTVVAPEEYEDDAAYNLVYDSTEKTLTLTKVTTENTPEN